MAFLLALAIGFLPAPVTKVHDRTFGDVLTTRAGLALYTWDNEKDFRVHCTDACAVAWPPLLVRSRIRTHISGIHGTFGTVRRPDGTTQVTFNRRPLYTYISDAPGRASCATTRTAGSSFACASRNTPGGLTSPGAGTPD